MEKSEELKRLQINVLDPYTIVIKGDNVFFSYSPVNDKFKDKYRYFGGLQCNYEFDTAEYKQIEKWLCEICENLLTTFNIAPITK